MISEKFGAARGVPQGWLNPHRLNGRVVFATSKGLKHYDEALKTKIVVGTPAMVVDRLAALKERLGLSGILAEMNCGMRIPHERVVNSLHLMCSEVMPHFRDQ